MHIRGLEITRIDGPELSDSVLEEMLALRAQFITIRHDVDPAQDRAQVIAWLRAPGCTVALGRDRDGILQTFIDMNARRVQHDGRARIVYFSNYVFAARSYRKHPGYVLGNLLNLGVVVRRHGVLAPVLLITSVYPSTFIASVRTFPRVWLSGESDVPRTYAAFAERMAAEVFGASWLPEQRLVRMRTIPEPLLPSSAEGKAQLARYEARNPRWRDGYGALMVLPLELGNVAGVFVQLGRRTLRSK